MKLRKDLKIRIIASLPLEGQNEFDLGKYMGKELIIVDHYQNHNSGLNEGQIQVNLIEEGGIIVLNENEWELV